MASESRTRQNYRRMLGNELSSRLLAHFKKHGIAAIERVHEENPAEYLRVCTRLIPTEIEAEVTHSFVDLLQAAADRARVLADANAINGEIDTETYTHAPKSLIHKESHGISHAIEPDSGVIDAELVETREPGSEQD